MILTKKKMAFAQPSRLSRDSVGFYVGKLFLEFVFFRRRSVGYSTSLMRRGWRTCSNPRPLLHPQLGAIPCGRRGSVEPSDHVDGARKTLPVDKASGDSVDVPLGGVERELEMSANPLLLSYSSRRGLKHQRPYSG